MESFEVYWGALSHPETNVMKLLVQTIETVAPVRYPTEDMMEKTSITYGKGPRNKSPGNENCSNA